MQDSLQTCGIAGGGVVVICLNRSRSTSNLFCLKNSGRTVGNSSVEIFAPQISTIFWMVRCIGPNNQANFDGKFTKAGEGVWKCGDSHDLADYNMNFLASTLSSVSGTIIGQSLLLENLRADDILPGLSRF